MEVQEINGFKGLFSTKSFFKGDLVLSFSGQEIDYPTRTSVQVGSRHVEVGPPVQYINHDCESNLRLEGKTFYAKEDIGAGVELTFNYLENEWDMAEKFKCRKCGQLVQGKKYVKDSPCLLKTF